MDSHFRGASQVPIWLRIMGIDGFSAPSPRPPARHQSYRPEEEGQRRRLEHAAFSHDWADDDLHRSANLTHGMMQRILRRRAVYVGVALLLIVAIFFTIWFKATHAASGQ